MGIISCALQCIHQIDGYCCIDSPLMVTNTEGGCVHFEENEEKNSADGE